MAYEKLHKIIFDAGEGIPDLAMDKEAIQEYEQEMIRILKMNLSAGRITVSAYELAHSDLKARIKNFLSRLDN